MTGVRDGDIGRDMKPSYALLVTVLVSASTVGQSPKPPQGEPLVLLLDDFKIVDGMIEQAKGEYVIRRGAEVRRISAKRVLFAGDSLTAVRQFLNSRVSGPPANTTAWQRQFNETVQPVLSNSCTSCHARSDRPGGFKLHPVSDRFADADGMRRNAAAAAAFVDVGDPARSPLLSMSVTAHGGQREPGIRGRGHPAFLNLERWVWAAVPRTVRPRTLKSGDPFDPTEFNSAAHPGR